MVPGLQSATEGEIPGSFVWNFLGILQFLSVGMINGEGWNLHLAMQLSELEFGDWVGLPFYKFLPTYLARR